MGKEENYRNNWEKTMKKTFYKFFLFLILTFLPFNLQAEILKKVEVYGNERIVKETIIVYGDIKENKDYTQEDIDNIVKNLYETKFFSSVSINFSKGVLKITVVENPIINSILIQGQPTKKNVTAILELLSLNRKFQTFSTYHLEKIN